MRFKQRIKTLIHKLLLKQHPPFQGWHSWDPHPWQHPWLTPSNLKSMREFSRAFLKNLREITAPYTAKDFHFGFCGNIANNLYLRIAPLRRAGLNITLYQHPQDNFVMSHPSWEIFDGTLPGDELDIQHLRGQGLQLPEVAQVETYPQTYNWLDYTLFNRPKFVKPRDLFCFIDYLSHTPTLTAMQKTDALLASQYPYLPYLANKPYIATQMGGDIWFEAARGDQLGVLQRLAFAKAKMFLASNPWSFAHARRYGFQHLIYLPLILDEQVYCPGEASFRAQWQTQSGGEFFILSTTRLDETYKGSSVGLNGVAEFIRQYPQARLVITAWGENQAKSKSLLVQLGIADKVIWLPLSGKAKLREYLRSADCFLGQFVLGYFGSADLEAMACGLPVIGRVEQAQYQALCETGAPPILHAKTATDVTTHLKKLITDTETHQAVATAHRQWFLDNHSAKRWQADYQAVLIAAAKHLPVNFKSSPLTQPLSAEEINYHQQGLANAPIFPNYN